MYDGLTHTHLVKCKLVKYASCSMQTIYFIIDEILFGSRTSFNLLKRVEYNVISTILPVTKIGL